MRADAERNRIAILNAAGRLICDKALDQVSMDEIATTAGVGKGTLFRHFTDREGLIRTLFDDRTARAWDTVRNLANDTTIPVGDRILAFVATLFDLTVIELQPLMRALPDNCQTETWAAWRALLTRLISEMTSDIDPEFLALAIFTSMRPEIADILPRHQHRDGVLALATRSLGIH